MASRKACLVIPTGDAGRDAMPARGRRLPAALAPALPAMSARPRRAALAALATGLCVATAAGAACVRVDAWRDDAARALVIADAPDATFAVTYVHSVTRTPVVERYRVEGDAIVQTEIDFVQHGPGLPTEPDAGGTFTQHDGTMVMTLARRFPEVVMRVHRDQSPRLLIGARSFDLAAFGNRAVALHATATACPAG
jgi:hypothetical protein